MAEKIDVVVVGAGISGIAAAAHLAERGIKAIVLEGRDRIGGRLFTDRTSGSAPYELGCSWLHEAGQNPLVKLAEKEHIAFVRDNTAGFYDANGPLDMTVEIAKCLQAFKQHVGQYWLNSSDDISYKDLVDRFIDSQKGLSQKAKDVVPQLLRIPELANGTPWEEISARSVGQDDPDDLIVLGGYDKILQAIKRHTLKDCVHTNQRVVDIDAASVEDRVMVKTHQGLEYEAKYVVVTVPVSVLRDNDISFTPKLPSSIRSAIDNTDVSRVGKVYFEFENPFWPVDLHKFIVTAIPGSRPKTAAAYPIVISNWYILNGERKFPGLAVLTPPPLTEQVEKDPGSAFELLRPVMEGLRVNKSQELPKPVKVVSSKWTVDEFSRGSYSMYKVGKSRERAAHAFEIGAGRIRFAGEHTILKGGGFSHGAYNSGLREANYILDHIE